MTESILSQLTLRRARLATMNTPSTSTEVVLSSRDSERKVRLGLPLAVRHTQPKRLGQRWPEFCGLLRTAGIALRCSAQELMAVPAANVPIRIGSRFGDEPFLSEELTTADLFELENRPQEQASDVEKNETSRVSYSWYWPAEIGRPGQLHSLVKAARAVGGGNAPIGITLPADVDADDLQLACNAGLDFLTLVATTEALDTPTVRGLVNAGRMIRDLEIDLPLVLDAPFGDAREAAICLALGADILTADHFLAGFLPADKPKKSPESTFGKLGDLPSKREKSPAHFAATESALQRLALELRQLTSACGVAGLAELTPAHVCTASSDLARICGISLMDNA